MGGPYLARQSLSHLSPYRPLMDLLSLGLALEAHSHTLPRTEDAQTTSKPEDLSWSQAKLYGQKGGEFYQVSSIFTRSQQSGLFFRILCFGIPVWPSVHLPVITAHPLWGVALTPIVCPL